jgi:hypothetical protein
MANAMSTWIYSGDLRGQITLARQRFDAGDGLPFAPGLDTSCAYDFAAGDGPAGVKERPNPISAYPNPHAACELNFS